MDIRYVSGMTVRLARLFTLGGPSVRCVDSDSRPVASLGNGASTAGHALPPIDGLPGCELPAYLSDPNERVWRKACRPKSTWTCTRLSALSSSSRRTPDAWSARGRPSPSVVPYSRGHLARRAGRGDGLEQFDQHERAQASLRGRRPAPGSREPVPRWRRAPDGYLARPGRTIHPAGRRGRGECHRWYGRAVQSGPPRHASATSIAL